MSAPDQPAEGQGSAAAINAEKSKICAVCGDKALGYNFNAVTCESCKAFFRRNALKEKEFKCPFNNECEVTVITRRFCQRCRLKKCFTIGMKKEHILSEEEKQQKKQKIQENRVRKHQKQMNRKAGNGTNHDSNDQSSSPPSSYNNGSHSPTDEQASKRLKVEHEPMPGPSSSRIFHQLLVQPEEASEVNEAIAMTSSEAIAAQNRMQNVSTTFPLRGGEPFQQPFASHQLNQAFQDNDWSFDNLDEIVAIAIKAEFNTFDLADLPDIKDEYIGPSTQPPDDSNHEATGSQQQCNTRPQLNEREKVKLDELYFASRALVEPVEHERESEPHNLISVINLTDLAIKRIIRMAKKITPFTTMCQADQIALLKGGCTELMILRSVFNYDPDKNSWRLPSKDRPRELRLEVLKEATELGVNLYEEHQRFVKSFDPQWRSDENVMLLLSAIALFTPERANVVHKDVVKLEQDSYYYLLRRYLETVCSNGCESRSLYLKLIGRLQDLHHLNESHIQVFLEVNPKLVGPLLIEIFDLQPRQ